MVAPTTKLLDQANDLLAGIVANWPGDAPDLPDLQYVSNGEVPWDGCATLAVALGRTFTTTEGDITSETIGTGPLSNSLRAGVFDVFLLRCAPMIEELGVDDYKLPTPAEITASAVEVLTDAQALTNAFLLYCESIACRAATVESYTAAGPEGGMAGGVMRVRML